MTPEHLQFLQRMCKEFRIEFTGELAPGQWPEDHEETLTCIQELGRMQYDKYEVDNAKFPWKKETKDAADILVESAKRCSSRNESSWRLSCEPLIFSRLSAEVVCPNCRKRLWRSEIETTRDDASAAEALRVRQNARSPCRCDRRARGADQCEVAGLNKIFGCRADDPVQYESEVHKAFAEKSQTMEIPKKVPQCPDRIYGLRLTRNIENLLYDTANAEVYNINDNTEPLQVHEILDPSPFKRPLIQTGDPLLFPFLVLEAKSGKSTDDWLSIQMQTAFPIRSFLQAQDAPRRAAGTRSVWKTSPLVWFFANRGDDWRLSAGFIQKGQENPHTRGNVDYRIVDLWRGSILSKDGALQLLLLVDHIFDWARDTYRDNIIKELRVLASQENDRTSCLYNDTDISSNPHYESSDHFSPEGGCEEFKAYQITKENFMALDSNMGTIRTADLVESRYCCVYITRDNIRTLMESIEQTKMNKFISLMFAHMADSNTLNQNTLNAVEEQWTGHSRLSRTSLISQTQFHAVLSNTTYLSGNWHQIRDLHVIAIATDALPALIRASKLIKRRGNAQTHGPVEPFDPPVLLDCIKRLKAGRPEDILLAAIQRRAVKVTKGEGDVPISIMPDDGGIRDIVHYIYKYIKRGIREPQQPFLRFSNREEQQNLLQIDRHPFPPGERLQVSDEGCVLITSDCHRQDPERSKSTICAYLVNEYADSPPKRDVLANVIRVTYQKHDVYHTTQDNGTSNINNITFTKRKTKTKKKFSNSVPWNLKDTYGMFGDGLDFVNFILHLGGRAPGIVPRAFNDSGSYLHKRMIRPWEDPRRICNGTRYQKRLFMRYKLLTLEIWYWRTVAKELSNNGGTCCICCAKLGEKDKCRDCQKALDDWERPEWYRNALLGKTPMRCKDVKMTGLGDRRSNSSSLPKDEDWREYLEAYPNLNDRFYNERMLLNQWKTFEIWRSEREEASQILSEKKRKRP